MHSLIKDFLSKFSAEEIAGAQKSRLADRKKMIDGFEENTVLLSLQNYEIFYIWM